MSLQKHVVPVGFKGIDTSKDPKVLGAELLRLENGLVDRVGAITKRTGQTSYAASHSQPFVAAYKDGAVLLDEGSVRVDDGTAFDVFPNSNATPFFSDIDLQCVLSKKNARYFAPDVVALANILVYVWTEYSHRTATYAVTIETRDKTTGAVINNKQQFGSGIHPNHGKVVSEGTGACVFSLSEDSDLLLYCAVNAAGDIGNAVAVDGGLPAGKPCSFDAIQCGDANNTILIAYIDANDDVTYLTFRSATGMVTHNHVAGTYISVGLWKHATGKYGMGYYSSARDVCVRILDDDLATWAAEVVAESLGAGSVVTCITGCSGINGSSTTGYMYYTVLYATAPPDMQVRGGIYAISGTTIGTTSFGLQVRRAKLASRPWSTTADSYLFVHYRAQPNTLGDSDAAVAAQSGYFLLSGALTTPGMGWRVAGKTLIGRAGETMITYGEGTTSACAVYAHSATAYRVCLLGWTSGQIGAGDSRYAHQNRATISDDVAVYLASITAGAPSALKTCEQELLFVPGGVPCAWDGTNLAEQGFLQYPEGLTISQANSASGALALTSTFGYLACYEWTDAKGQVHRSAPSPAITMLLTGTNDTLTVTVPSLTLSKRTNVQIVLYRTDANGSVYYRLASCPAQGAGDSVMFVDTGALVVVVQYGVSSVSYTGTGTSLLSTSGAPWVYTTGNVIENIQPSPHRVACIHGGRYVYADREWESTTIRYSRYIIDGEPPGWNDVMTIQVPAEGGAITALASFQDRLIVFKADRVLVVSGTGLSDAGTGQDYAPPTLLHAGFGCTNQKSVVQLPDGLAFLSARGLCLIDANFQVTADFGAPVKYHTDTLTVSSANLVPQKGYAIWTTTTGAALVYCYQWKQWSTFTNYAASDAAVAGGILYRHYSTTVSKENRSSFLDGSTPVVMKLVTGWISLQGLLGFGRLYRVMLMGQNISSHTLNLAMGYDFDPVWQTALTFSAASFAQSNYADHYGAGLSAGTYTDKAYILEADSPRQRLTAVRFMIYDSGAATAEGYSINAMAMLIGAKGGLWRGDGIAGTRGLG